MNTVDHKFRYAYKELRKQNAFRKGSNYVSQLSKSMLGETAQINETTINGFLKISGYKIEFENMVAFFPVNTAKDIVGNGKSGLAGIRETFAEVDLVVPPFMPLGFLSKLAQSIKAQPESRSNLLKEAFFEMYPVTTVASFCTEVYSQSDSFKPNLAQIIQACESYYLVLDHSSITLLLPSIEAIIRRIGKRMNLSCDESIDKQMLLDVIEKVQRNSINESTFKGYNWVPVDFRSLEFFDSFDQRIQMLQSLRFYIKNKLYEHSSRLTSRSRVFQKKIFIDSNRLIAMLLT